jgi:hypothetical protein
MHAIQSVPLGVGKGDYSFHYLKIFNFALKRSSFRAKLSAASVPGIDGLSVENI